MIGTGSTQPSKNGERGRTRLRRTGASDNAQMGKKTGTRATTMPRTTTVRGVPTRA